MLTLPDLLSYDFVNICIKIENWSNSIVTVPAKDLILLLDSLIFWSVSKISPEVLQIKTQLFSFWITEFSVLLTRPSQSSSSLTQMRAQEIFVALLIISHFMTMFSISVFLWARKVFVSVCFYVGLRPCHCKNTSWLVGP